MSHEDTSGGGGQLPASRVADAGSCVPRDGRDLVVGFLDPDRVTPVEMNDGAERLAIVEAVLDVGGTSEAGESGLNPGVSGDSFDARKSEVLHYAESFGVRSEVSVEEAVSSGIFIRVGKREFVADGVPVEKSEGVADADIQVDPGNKTGAIEIRSRHDKEIC